MCSCMGIRIKNKVAISLQHESKKQPIRKKNDILEIV
jgi:hypothetical protein